MSKILKNQTGSAITINDVGFVVIPASPGQYTIPPQDYDLWAASSDVITEVGASNIVVNDGSFDLSISDGIDLIKGIFSRFPRVKDATIKNLSLAVAGTEYSYTFPNATSRIYVASRKHPSQLRFAFAAGDTAIEWVTIPIGNAYTAERLNIQQNYTIYLQSNKDNTIAEILSWDV